MAQAGEGAAIPVSDILDILAEIPAGQGALAARLSPLVDEVHVLDAMGPEDGEGSATLVLELWGDQQPYATIICNRVARADFDAFVAEGAGEDTRFAQESGRPLAEGARARTLVTLQYWDPDAAVSDFVDTAAHWAERRIGPLAEEDPPAEVVGMRFAVNHAAQREGGVWAASVVRASGGAESEALVSLVSENFPAR